LFEKLLSISEGTTALIVGAVIALIICIILKRNAKRKRLCDERQNFVRLQGKAASWNVTSIVLLMALAFILIYEGFSFAFYLIGGIYLLHCFSLIFTTVYYNKKN